MIFHLNRELGPSLKLKCRLSDRKHFSSNSKDEERKKKEEDEENGEKERVRKFLSISSKSAQYMAQMN